MPDTTTPHPFSEDKARFTDLGRRMLEELKTHISDMHHLIALVLRRVAAEVHFSAQLAD